MNILYKNFVSILRRFPMSIVMNILGLALAFSAFIVIMMEVHFEVSYDKNLEYKSRIFLLTTTDAKGTNCCVSRPLASEIAKLSPEIEKMSLKELGWYIHVCSEDGLIELNAPSHGVFADYFSMFSFNWVICDTTAFNQPGKIFIPESMARRLFQRTDLVGTPLCHLNQKQASWTIGGVYKDFPENCSIENHVYNTLGDYRINDHVEWSFPALYQLKDPSKKAAIEKLIQDYHMTSKLKLLPYEELFYHPEYRINIDSVKGNLNQRYIYIAICILIILIAAINFTNFYTALAPIRMRSLNTQRILGAPRSLIVRNLITESTLLALLAWGIALLLVKATEESYINELLKVNISLAGHFGIALGTGGIALLTGLLSGLYPAFYTTSFQPALVLKGNFGLTAKGRYIRNLLMSIQLTSATILLIGVGGIILQNHFMRHSDLGYDQDRIITLNLGAFNGKADALLSEIKEVACVEDAALSRFVLSAQNQNQIMGWTRGCSKADGKPLSFNCIPVSPNYLKVMGIKLIDGEDFNPKDQSSPYIFNRAATEAFPEDIRVGESIDNEPIVGICENFNFGSLKEQIVPCCLKIFYEDYGTGWKCVANIRIKEGVDLLEALAPLQECCKKFNPEATAEFKTQFEVMEYIYIEEKLTQQSLTIFCLLAVFISLSGVFSMTLFECSYRRKEIGLRKIMGATSGEIIAIFFRQYGLLLIGSFFVAGPLGYYTIYNWLQGFAYKTPIFWWIFALSFGLIALIVLTTVYYQCRQTARDNPINSIRTE